MRNQIKFILLVLFVITIAACGRTGDLIPNNESKVDSVEADTNS